MSFEVLSERLNALQDANAQLRDLIERLANMKFQPGSIPLGSGEDNAVVELRAQIQDTIKDQNEDFELLYEEALDITAGRPGSETASQKSALTSAVKRAMQELQSLQIDFRKAQLKAKRNLEAAQREERLLISQSYMQARNSNSLSPAPSLRPQAPERRKTLNKELTKEEKTVNAASDVTLALRRTHDMMASELSRSQFAHDTLRESTAALAQLGETYSALDTMLSTSRNLIGTLLRSQKSDTWYLETAFYVLLATIAWLVYRRFLYGPLWWFVFFPVRLFYRSLIGVLTGIGLVGGTAVSSSSPSAGSGSILHSSISVDMPEASMVDGGVPPLDKQAKNSPGTADDSLVEEIGKIIDERDLGVEEQGHSEPVPNPKKRMWEEETERVPVDGRKKDEL
ncbi:hypothetical protein BP5796_07446 [Coleophoma crateriformis]|uniref:Sec20 C-terminal domain-containing protein n=1 Tax=Coleophoma crateriformis TaxID=565419 RepID=A0A3D8RJD7_9HELO|nr:hypothetical protein BP5796_07446 [Coleophoma crateriformis]